MDPAVLLERDRYLALLADLGKGTLNALYPDEFEYYMMSLELADYKDQTIEFFSFPVLPKNFSEVEQTDTNIKKTLSSVTSIKSTGFIPRDLRISGNFGRSLKFLLGSEFINGSAFTLSAEQGSGDAETSQEAQVFSNIIKTGYGCFKMLESILRKSKKTDEGLPRRLYFYNPAVGNSYLVEFMEMNKSTSQEENMIWGYSLFLRAIAPLSSLRDSSSGSIAKTNSKNAVNNFINVQANGLVSDLTQLGIPKFSL